MISKLVLCLLQKFKVQLQSDRENQRRLVMNQQVVEMNKADYGSTILNCQMEPSIQARCFKFQMKKIKIILS